MKLAAGRIMLIMKATAAAGLVLVLILPPTWEGRRSPSAGTSRRLTPRGGDRCRSRRLRRRSQWGGVIEKDINLAITLQLREILLATGHRVALTRYGDYSLIEQDQVSNPKKREDMARRLAIIEKCQPDVVIVIHCNAINSPIWSGAQTFYQEGYDRGKLLAEDIQKYLVEFTETNRKASSLDMYLLRESSMVGSLVEAGFVSNARERALLQQEGYQRRIATAIWLGLSHYLRDTALENQQ